ncbi:MAG: heavy metal translocating P-type ATPase [Ruminococcaceae bacterium]|nr:heavy metal translocating P-type ATPase [Oscillospiraceae bacterium]
MKVKVLHRAKGQMQLDLACRRLGAEDADTLYYALGEQPGIRSVSVLMRTGQVLLRFDPCVPGAPEQTLRFLRGASLSDPELKKLVPAVSGRATNEQYKEEIGSLIMARVAKRLLLPAPLRYAWTIWNGLPFIRAGLKDLAQKKFSAEIVHASAILASLLTADFPTAGSIIFLTKLGEILEEWTYKKSVDDLARSLALNVSKVWRVEGETTELVSLGQVRVGERIHVYMGNVIPLDGVVVEGEAMVNQSALTGESIPVHKEPGLTVYAGTAIDEGDLVIEVRETSGQTRYDNIVKFIERSESMVAVTQSQAEKLVSRLIPYTFGTAALTWLLTRSVTKAASVLMVDFSCAIEVAMPISVLSAMREAGAHHITVKGGKYLELISEADTVVFDKTGTLTRSVPTVEAVLPMAGRDENDMLALAADLEAHFPHSLASAVVKAARDRGLDYGVPHSKPEYIVAHGIVSIAAGQRVVIGSHHFVFDDENTRVRPEDEEKLHALPLRYSQLYMAIDGELAAIIGIDDPIKPETRQVVRRLKQAGLRNIVMMTGDSERTAAAIAEEAGIDRFFAEVLPEDKARFVEQEKSAGHRVIMIGDGINDSPALSAADVGIAMKEGADIAREIADITLSGSNLEQLIALKELSDRLMGRMHTTGTLGIAANGAILLAGILGLVTPGVAALLHNTSTIALCLRNMTELIPDERCYYNTED